MLILLVWPGTEKGAKNNGSDLRLRHSAILIKIKLGGKPSLTIIEAHRFGLARFIRRRRGIKGKENIRRISWIMEVKNFQGARVRRHSGSLKVFNRAGESICCKGSDGP